MSLELDLKNLQQQICSCYDVYLYEICDEIDKGVIDVDKISEQTYACQGCGGCREKIEYIIQSCQKQSKPAKT